MCVVLFTDKDKTDKSNSEVKVITNTHNNETTNPIPTIQDNENSNIDKSSGEMSTDEKTTNNQTLKGETQKVVESQVSSETQPKTYKNDETTSAYIKGTTATINSSCFIRSSADISGNVLGTANAGTTYNIDVLRSNESWLAIVMESGQVGYVAASYCTVQ